MNKNVLFAVLVLNSFVGCLAMDKRGAAETSGLDKLMAAIDIMEQPRVGSRSIPVGTFKQHSSVVGASTFQDVPGRAVSSSRPVDDSVQPPTAKSSKIAKVVAPPTASQAQRRESFVEGVMLPVSVIEESDLVESAKFSPGEQRLERDVVCGNCLYAQTYLDQGVDVHFGNDRLMRLAIKGRNTRAMCWLFQHDFDVHFNNDELMKKALEWHDFEMIRFLIVRGADVHFNNDEPMKVAVEKQSFLSMRFLIDKGVDVHFNDDQPMKVAIEKRDFNFIRFLIDKGVDIRLWSEALFRCVTEGSAHFGLATWLLDQRVQVPDFFIQKIISRGCCLIMCALVEHGVDVHLYREDFVKKSLMKGCWDTIKLLLDRGIVKKELVQQLAKPYRADSMAKKVFKELEGYVERS